MRSLKTDVGFEDLVERLSNIFDSSRKDGAEEGIYIGRDFQSMSSLEDLLLNRIGDERKWSILFPSSGRETARFFGSLSEIQENYYQSSPG